MYGQVQGMGCLEGQVELDLAVDQALLSHIQVDLGQLNSRFGLAGLGLEQAVIDLEQEIAGLDRGAFLHLNIHKFSTDFRRHLDGLGGNGPRSFEKPGSLHFRPATRRTPPGTGRG